MRGADLLSASPGPHRAARRSVATEPSRRIPSCGCGSTATRSCRPRRPRAPAARRARRPRACGSASRPPGGHAQLDVPWRGAPLGSETCVALGRRDPSCAGWRRQPLRCSEVVERHGGEIWYQRELRLPQARVPAPAAAARRRAGAAAACARARSAARVLRLRPVPRGAGAARSSTSSRLDGARVHGVRHRDDRAQPGRGRRNRLASAQSGS